MTDAMVYAGRTTINLPSPALSTFSNSQYVNLLIDYSLYFEPTCDLEAVPAERAQPPTCLFPDFTDCFEALRD